jgi:Uma2 family endonuclease
MGEAARRRLTVEGWLAYDDGTDTRYELVGGELVATASSSDRHGTIAQNVGDVIQQAVRDRPPCRAVQGAGIEVDVRGDRRGYVADVVLTCRPAGDDLIHREPRLIVEILSPSTAGVDKGRKVPDYATLPSVEEIWLVDSRMRFVVTWRRVEGGAWVGSFPYMGDGAFNSPALGCHVQMDRLYLNTGL